MAVVNPPLLPPGVAVHIVEEQPNPSTDYFVAPACEGEGRQVHRHGFDDVPPAQALAGTVVVFVRYLPAAWMRQVDAVRDRLAGLVFFMDDDLLDARAAAGMPWRYRYKLFRLATRHREWLRSRRAQVWVSTGWLAQRYADWNPRRLAPRPLAQRSDVRRVFYHGTASHAAEIRWLRPVMERVLAAEPRAAFEIVGGSDVGRLYRGLPRVWVVQPMKWAAYQAFVDMPGRHVGLAPLLDVPFNRARSSTKFFDITRCGAAGVYARGPIYGEVVRDGIEGLLLPQDAAAWSDAILQLVRDDARREAIVQAARAALARDAGGG